MQVFRVCDKTEIDKILGVVDFRYIGAPGEMYKRNPEEVSVNNHIYEENEMYMHFFPKFGDLFYINLEEEKYICIYDIPEEILDESIGYGEYKDLFTLSLSRQVPLY